MIKRYFRLYWKIIKINLFRELQFKANFLLDNLITAVWSALMVLYYLFIYRHVSAVNGWELNQVLALTGIYFIFNSVLKSLIELNFSRFPEIIYKGELDYFLIKPVNSQFLVSFSRFSLRSFTRLFAGLLIVCWSVSRAKITITIFETGIVLLSFLLGLIIIYSLWFITMLSAFIFGNIENLYYFFMPVFQIARMPIDVFPKPLEILFTFILPLIFISSVPAQALWQNFSLNILIFGGGSAAILLWFSNKLWGMALKTYTSASS